MPKSDKFLNVGNLSLNLTSGQQDGSHDSADISTGFI